VAKASSVSILNTIKYRPDALSSRFLDTNARDKMQGGVCVLPGFPERVSLSLNTRPRPEYEAGVPS
jgi:hypothetical protein